MGPPDSTFSVTVSVPVALTGMAYVSLAIVAVVVLAADGHRERAYRLAVDADLRGCVGTCRYAHMEPAHGGTIWVRERDRLAIACRNRRGVEEIASARIPAVTVYLVQAVIEIGRGIERVYERGGVNAGGGGIAFRDEIISVV